VARTGLTLNIGLPAMASKPAAKSPLAKSPPAKSPTATKTASTGSSAKAAGKPIGFVGIGNMGAPMVRCLAKAGFDVCLYDVNGSATSGFAAEGGRFKVAADLPALGAACDTVITMLPTSKIVRAATIGSKAKPGFAAALRDKAIVIDMSSSYPLDTRRLGAELAKSGIAMVDAPVSGGVPKAVTGTLAIMAGGDADVIESMTPLLSAMGTVHRTGALGSGHAMKALNNYLSAAGLIATAEALIIGQKFGLDGVTMAKILNASTGRNNTTENKAERYLLSGQFNSGFALALMEKDVGMARQLAEALKLDAGALQFTSAYLERALSVLGPDADHTAVYAFAEGAGGED
jgi:3-hydroxyisobutyrate dehydrogenase